MSLADLERLRIADRSFETDRSLDIGGSDAGVPDIVGVVGSAGSFPTVAGRYYLITAQVVTGTEAEGQTGTFTTMSRAFYALNVGLAVPTNGTTKVVCSYVDNRWVFEY